MQAPILPQALCPWPRRTTGRSVGTRPWGHRYPTHLMTKTSNTARKVARAHVAVPEAAGVHWRTFSGVVPVLPQLLASRLVPLIVPLKVPPCAGMTVGLVQVPARTGAPRGPRKP